jgi:hypothetical protein
VDERLTRFPTPLGLRGFEPCSALFPNSVRAELVEALPSSARKQGKKKREAFDKLRPDGV